MAGFSFEVVNARDYEELRPSYPPEAVAWVAERGGIGRGSRIVDLAAGTGQLSRLLVSLGPDTIAVEPASNMRAALERQLPSVRVVDGRAETLPFEDRSVDGVVVGNAFHHFDREGAVAEIRRVLRHRGVLALFWAWQLEEEQRSIPRMEGIFELVQEHRAASEIIAAYRSWADVPPAESGFEPFERREFPATQITPSARLADLYATSRDVASIPPPDREELLAAISCLAKELPETLHLPARTVVDLCFRSG